MKKYLLILRPYQWIKQFFIFLPLFFDRRLTDTTYLSNCIITFFAFSFAASSIYCLNDIIDVESDRMHPEKCKRPIASGFISIKQAFIIMALLILMSFLLIFFFFRSNMGVMIQVLGIILFYIILNILYCIILKKIALIDIFVISLGFVLRVLIGGIVINTVVTHWIILMTFLLALFLTLAKRRDDVVLYCNKDVKTRKNINRYNLDFMNQSISIVATITIISYIMYTVSPEVIGRLGSEYIYITTIWVLLGILRYLQVTIVDVKSGSPTKVLIHDHLIQICVVGWITTFFFILYF